MKKETEEKTRQESIKDLIWNMPLDPEYRDEPNLPIPLKRSVLVKKISQSSIQVLESGLMLLEGESERNTPPHIGIIAAVGPECSDYLRVGLRCYYNFYCDSSFRVNGIEYAKMDENDVYYICKPNNFAVENLKSDKQMHREMAMERNKKGYANLAAKEANEKDKAKDKTKGKNRFLN